MLGHHHYQATFPLNSFQIDKVDRVIFMWKNEVSDQKERASDMRRRNEALVYNVLPMHVAEHFMGNRKRSHDELYSQSYAAVGVLFASMPNFSDFYSEETVNNQGLECLRFLNEVISDFDAVGIVDCLFVCTSLGNVLTPVQPRVLKNMEMQL